MSPTEPSPPLRGQTESLLQRRPPVLLRVLGGLLLGLLGLGAPAPVAARGTDPPITRSELSALNASFTLRGKPIHPHLLRLFEPSHFHDGRPVVTALDLAAAHDTNEYFQGDIRQASGRLSVNASGSSPYYAYQWLGRLPKGAHLVRTWMGTRGSAVFQSLLVVRFEMATARPLSAKPYEQLLMKVESVHGLGDRSDVTLDLTRDRLVVTLRAFPTGETRRFVLDLR